MKRWQIATLGTLVLVPILVYALWGGYAIWRLGGLGYLAWIVPLAWTVAWWLARRWQPQGGHSTAPASTHWTERDEAAWRIVARRAEGAVEIPPEQMLDPHFYLTAAQHLALDVARHYSPNAADPLGRLTVPEVMAAAELALRDTSQWVRDYVPGSHLLRIDHWRMVAQAPRWARLARNAWWVGSILLNPAEIVRQLISKVSVDSASRELQAGLLAGFYAVFIQRVGFYLIEVHSGRLRLGADHYRDVQRRFGPPSPHSAAESPTPPSTAAPPAAARPPGKANAKTPPGAEDGALTLVVAGQAKAGKSSLINALLGSSQAAVDILPCTHEVRRYRLRVRGTDAELALLDSPGYGDDGLTDPQLDEIHSALEFADALLLVLDATSPARQGDLQVLDQLATRLRRHPERKAPPVIGVLTHIDGLRPVLEWDPPYDWQNPTRPKERTIRDAVEYNAEQFGARVRAFVPVCTDGARNRVYGLEEWLFPVLLSNLDETRACALLRHLHQDWDRQKIKQLWQQLANLGQSLWQRI